MNLLFIFILFTAINYSLSIFHFPKQIWLYWDSPINQAPITIQLCYNHFVNVAMQNRWNLTLLSDLNLPLYVKNYQENIEKVVKNAKVVFKQNKADLIRLTVLQQHGGVYFDISSVLIHGLDWLQKLDGQLAYLMTNMIHKQNSSQYQPPQMIVPYINFYQSTTEWRQSQSSPLTNPEPGYEIWFIACKAHSKAITQWRYWYAYFYQRTLKENLIQYEDQGIYYRSIETNYYLTANKAFYYLYQLRQREIDKEINLLWGQRKYAYEYYKIWSFHGEYGPMAFYLQSIPDKSKTMFQSTIQQIRHKYFDIKFYVKLTTYERPFVDALIEFQIQLKKNESSFDKLIKSKAGYEYCKSLSLPVQGSVIGLLLENNSLAKQLGLFVLNKQQLSKWHQYCQSDKSNKLGNSLNSQQSQSLLSLLSPSSLLNSLTYLPQIGTLAPIYQIKLYEQGEQMSVWQKICAIIKSNILVIKIFQLKLIITMAQLFLVWLIVIKGVEWLSRLVNKENIYSKYRTREKVQQHKLFKDSINSIKSQKYPQEQQIHPHDKIQNKLLSFTYILTVVIVFTNFHLFNKTGDIYADDRFYLILLWTLMLVRYIRNEPKLNHLTIFGIKLTIITNIYDQFIYYNLGKILLHKLQITRPNHLFMHSVICFCILPYLVSLISSIKNNQSLESSHSKSQTIGNPITRMTKYIETYFCQLIIGFITVLRFTNIRYFIASDEERYIISKSVILPLVFTFIIYGYLAGVKISQFWKCWKQRKQLKQNNKSMHSQSQSKLNWLIITITNHNLFELVGILLLYIWVSSTSKHFQYYMDDWRRDQLQRYILNYTMLLHLSNNSKNTQTLSRQHNSHNILIFTHHIVPFIYPLILVGITHQLRISLYPVLNIIAFTVFGIVILAINNWNNLRQQESSLEDNIKANSMTKINSHNNHFFEEQNQFFI